MGQLTDVFFTNIFFSATMIIMSAYSFINSGILSNVNSHKPMMTPSNIKPVILKNCCLSICCRLDSTMAVHVISETIFNIVLASSTPSKIIEAGIASIVPAKPVIASIVLAKKSQLKIAIVVTASSCASLKKSLSHLCNKYNINVIFWYNLF